MQAHLLALVQVPERQVQGQVRQFVEPVERNRRRGKKQECG